MATPYNQYNRPMSTEMGDQWSKNELDDMLRPPHMGAGRSALDEPIWSGL